MRGSAVQCRELAGIVVLYLGTEAGFRSWFFVVWERGCPALSTVTAGKEGLLGATLPFWRHYGDSPTTVSDRLPYSDTRTPQSPKCRKYVLCANKYPGIPARRTSPAMQRGLSRVRQSMTCSSAGASSAADVFT